jgi:hypothetical protein
LVDGGAQRPPTNSAVAGQSTINDETICDGNGVSWGDGGCAALPFTKGHPMELLGNQQLKENGHL